LAIPAAIKMCEVVHGDKIPEELQSIPIFNDTIKKE